MGKIISKRGIAAGKAKPNDQLTQQQIKEVLYCMDPVYFIDNYIKYDDTLKGPQSNLSLYAYQADFVNTIHAYNHVIGVLPRAAGTTTVSIAYAIWQAIFNNDQQVVIMTGSQASALNISASLHEMVSYLPAWLRPQIKGRFVNAVEFANGSRVTCKTYSPHSLRGMTVSTIILDAFSFATIQDQHDFWYSAAPAFSQSSKIIVTGTPQSRKDSFYALWSSSMVGKTMWTPFRKTIHDLPQFDQHWKSIMRSAVGTSTWLREFECEFV